MLSYLSGIPEATQSMLFFQKDIASEQMAVESIGRITSRRVASIGHVEESTTAGDRVQEGSASSEKLSIHLISIISSYWGSLGIPMFEHRQILR